MGTLFLRKRLYISTSVLPNFCFMSHSSLFPAQVTLKMRQEVSQYSALHCTQITGKQLLLTFFPLFFSFSIMSYPPYCLGTVCVHCAALFSAILSIVPKRNQRKGLFTFYVDRILDFIFPPSLLVDNSFSKTYLVKQTFPSQLSTQNMNDP